MANWAALQEQLTGKRVVKRAKHSIHFDNGNGSITANFSGKPCHFQDTDGLWKPIDTRLLLGADGFYGCPHSPVKVHKDGRVKVDKSDYSQFTKLPGSPLGRVDGDKIVREFPGGYQELFVTEDGFREVITVVKRTFPIEKFLAKQSGTLPSAYKTSPQTAVDANGNEFVITSDTKAFGDWMEGAVYPVTIDPDFSGTTGVGADVHLTSPTVSPTRNYGTAPDLSWNYWRVLFRWDLSSVSAAATCTAASLKFTKTSATNTTRVRYYNLYKISDANGDWVEGTKNNATAGAGEPCYDAKFADGSGGVTTAWAGGAGMPTAGTDFINTELMTQQSVDRLDDQYTVYTWDLNAAGLAVLQDWFGDATNNGLLLAINDTSGGVSVGSSENATESYRPVLTVTYTAAGGLLRRTNMNAQMQSLTGGFN